MESKTLSIVKIEIETFKKIKNLILEPGAEGNLFYGSFRSGKTSLCEFIQFVLYGQDSVSLARDNAEDALGRIRLVHGEKHYLVERSVIGGKEECSFVDCDTNLRVETELTPGEYLTGMDHTTFDLIAYFRQARYKAPVFKPEFNLLEELASFHSDTKDIYREEADRKKLVESFRNAERSGSLDLLQKEKEEIQKEIADRPQWEEEKASCEASLQEISQKLDENDRRCVLLKADMAGFADDLKLSRNKENAEDLRKSIQAKEKKCRILAYDITQKIGLLTEDELDDMREDYNRLSMAETDLAEARTALSAAEENLAFHRTLFSEEETREHYDEVKSQMAGMKAKRMILRILGIVFMGIGASLFFLFHFMNYSLTACLAGAGSVILCGCALEAVSTVFTGKIQALLEENGKADPAEFYDFYEKLCAHEKTTQVYLEQVNQCEETCKRKSEAKENITRGISKKITALGYTDESGDLLAICDQIIEANDSLYDLKHEIENDEKEYRLLLSADVESKTLTVSPEFAALQKELSFLSVQNDSLYKKRTLVTARLAEASKHLARSEEELAQTLGETEEAINAGFREFGLAELSYSVAKGRKERFEDALKETLNRSINEKISFLFSEEESFFFDDNFELCFRDKNSVLPLISAGGGIVSELGLLAFRLSFAQLLGKTSLPMIFDDSFSMLSPEATKRLYQVLCETCSQFFIASSSNELFELCRDSAKVFSL